jgi:D-alanyl-D-alanine carboxypeptidase
MALDFRTPRRARAASILLLAATMACSARHVSSPGPASTAAPGPIPNSRELQRRERLRAVLDEYRTKSGFPGAVASVYLSDGTSVDVAVGVADRDLKTPMETGSRMLAGSVGKTFFAALALQLVAEGRLGLDDPVKKYLGAAPWFSRLPNGSRLTVRMLMNHTSGVGDYSPEVEAELVKEPDRERTPPELLESVLGREPLFPPGERLAYSDLNYILLALVCEEVTGRSAYEEIERRLLKPLKLGNVIPSVQPRIPGLVPGYAGKASPWGDAMMKDGRLTLNPQFEGGGGGFAATAGDLARWIAAFCQGRAFSRSLLGEVFHGVDASSLGEGSRYGLGIQIHETRWGTAYGHGGYFPGYLSWARYYPDHGLAVAVQVNSSDDALFPRRLRDVLDDLAGAFLE